MNTQSIKAVAVKAITNPKVINAAFAIGFVTEMVLRNKYHAKTIAERKASPKTYAAKVLVSAVHIGYGATMLNKWIAKLVAIQELEKSAHSLENTVKELEKIMNV